MLLKSKITFLILSTVVLADKAPKISRDPKIIGYCDTTKCTNEARLQLKSRPQPIITIAPTKIEVEEWNKPDEILYTYRWRKTTTCYQGTILDGNTGCSPMNRNIPYSREEAINDYNKGYCRTGYECGNNECWGSDWEKCNTDELINNNGPSTMGSTYLENMKFAHHTCMSRWACVNKKITPLVSMSFNKGDTIRYFQTTDRTIVILDDNFYMNGKKLPDGSVLYSLNGRPKSVTYHTQATCYSTNKENIKCSYENRRREEVAVSVNVDTFKGIHRTSVITVLSPLKTIYQNKAITIPVPQYLKEIGENSQLGKQRATSIDEVNEIINGLRVTQMQEVYNVMSNRERITLIENLLVKTISFLSKKNPFLLSTITGKNYKTKWLNNEVFQICPCSKKKEFNDRTNCQDGFTYIEGEVAKGMGIENCISLDDGVTIRNISLIDDSHELDLHLIDYEGPMVSASDSSTWDWLVQQRVAQHEYMETHDGSDMIQGVLGNFVVIPTWKEIMIYFSFAMSLWFFLLNIVGRLRR